MSLPVQPLLSLVKDNANGLKLILKNYIDFTVEQQFDQLKNSIVQMIESGQIDLNPPPEPVSTQPTASHGDSSDEEDNVVDNETYQIGPQNPDVNVSPSVQPSSSHHQTALSNPPIVPSTLNNSNDQFIIDQTTCPPAPTVNHIITSEVIKQDCLEEKDDCDCKDCLNQIKQEVEDRADTERFVAIQPNIDYGQLLGNPSRDIQNASNENESIEVDTQIGLNENEIEDSSIASLKSDLFLNVIDQSNQSTHIAIDLSLLINESEQQNVSKSTKQMANQQQNSESTQSAQSVNEHIQQSFPSTSGLRSSDKKRIQKKMFGYDGQSNVQVKSDKRKSMTQLSKAVKKVKPQNVKVIEIEEEEEEEVEQTVTIDKIVTLELDCTEPDCKLTFKSLQMWKEHLSSHGKLAYKRLYDNARLNQHGQTEYPCTECDVVCKTKSALTKHWKLNHQAGKFKCSDCAFVAKLSCEVRKHQRKHPVRKRFHCTHEGCDKAFKTNYDLEQHKRSHNKERPYKCAWGKCKDTFTLRSEALAHVRFHHFNIVDTRDPQMYVRPL